MRRHGRAAGRGHLRLWHLNSGPGRRAPRRWAPAGLPGEQHRPGGALVSAGREPPPPRARRATIRRPWTRRRRGEAPPPRADLLPIAFADGAVTVGDGMLLLDRVSPQARVQHPAGTDMVLLSFAVSGGDAAMEDFALGAVSDGQGAGHESSCRRGSRAGGLPCNACHAMLEEARASKGSVDEWQLRRWMPDGGAAVRSCSAVRCLMFQAARLPAACLTAHALAPSRLQLHCKRWLCCARNKLWWMTPEWGRTARELPPETQVGRRRDNGLPINILCAWPSRATRRKEAPCAVPAGLKASRLEGWQALVWLAACEAGGIGQLRCHLGCHLWSTPVTLPQTPPPPPTTPPLSVPAGRAGGWSIRLHPAAHQPAEVSRHAAPAQARGLP